MNGNLSHVFFYALGGLAGIVSTIAFSPLGAAIGIGLVVVAMTTFVVLKKSAA